MRSAVRFDVVWLVGASCIGTPFAFAAKPVPPATACAALAAGTTVVSANPLGDPGSTSVGDAFVPCVLSFDMDTDAPTISARFGPCRESAMEFTGTSTDDGRFRKSGGKLILYAGQADRPLCAYPKQARYVGEGSIEDAANFRCELPEAPRFKIPWDEHDRWYLRLLH
ncbi:MAG TPA: hypothetical protein VF203_12275 [Burkholderiales bacterium]